MNRFIVSQWLFLRALTEAKKVILKNPTVPILEYFLLEVADGKLTVTGTDLGRTVSVKVSCEHNKGVAFDAVVPSKILKFISALEDQPVACEWHAATSIFEITTNEETVKFLGEEPKCFPRKPKFEIIAEATLPYAVFDELPAILEFVSTNEEQSEILCGVNFQGQAELGLSLHATDGHTLRKTVLGPTTLNQSFTIESGVAKLLSAFRTKKKTARVPGHDFIDLTLAPYNVRFCFKDNTGLLDIDILGRTINNPYPDFAQVIPRSFSTEISASINDLNRLIAKTEVIMDRGSKLLYLQIKQQNNNVLITTDETFVEDQYEGRLNAFISGCDLTVGFYVPFLKRILASINNEQVTFKFNTSTDAVIIEENNSLNLIMPADPRNNK